LVVSIFLHKTRAGRILTVDMEITANGWARLPKGADKIAPISHLLEHFLVLWVIYLKMETWASIRAEFDSTEVIEWVVSEYATIQYTALVVTSFLSKFQQTIFGGFIRSPPEKLRSVSEMATCEAIIFDFHDDHRHYWSPNLGEGRNESAAVATNEARFLNDWLQFLQHLLTFNLSQSSASNISQAVRFVEESE